jgi:hypothetical protein
VASAHDVRGVENQVKNFNHPQLGRFSLQQMYWYSAPRNGSRLLVYLPMDEAGEQALLWLDKQDSLSIATGNADERNQENNSG